MIPLRQPVRNKPDDYWQSQSFVRRYVQNNVVTLNDNPGSKIFYNTSMAAIAQGIQYLRAKPQSILYPGCGHSIRGSLMQKTFGCPVVGVDYSLHMLAEAERLQSHMPEEARVTFQHMNVEALEFEDESFDVAFTYGLLMCLPDARKGVAEMLRVVRYGIVGIEECDRIMTPEQHEYWSGACKKKYPGRIYWHDYIALFSAGRQMMFTPLPTPAEWDQGQPPAYMRYIVVKSPEEQVN